MAQPGVAREPSMEEILASIRRIIESNEPASASSGALVQDEADGDEADAGSYRGAPHPVISDSLGTPLRAANISEAPSRPVSPVTATEKPQSLADIAARVRNAAAAAQPFAAVAEEAPHAIELPEEREEPIFDVEPYMPVAVSVPAVPLDMAAALAPVVGDDIAFDLPEVSVEAGRMQLVSQEAGLLVARSFDDLAEAVDGARRRSLDEIAEEMLRPMLREWLDDNLPTLVERLVREEIERVARGPRR